MDRREALPLGAGGIVDAEPPGAAVLVAADVEIAARLNHEVAQAGRTENRPRALDGVAFADAAEMDLHPVAFQKHRAGAIVDLDLPVVDERQPRANRLGRRDR